MSVAKPASLTFPPMNESVNFDWSAPDSGHLLTRIIVPTQKGMDPGKEQLVSERKFKERERTIPQK